MLAGVSHRLKLGRIVGLEDAERFFKGERKTLLVKFEVLRCHFTEAEIMSIIASGLGVWANQVTAVLAAEQAPATPPAIQGNSADVAALQALGVQAKVLLPTINADGTITAPPVVPPAA